jgi:hypothetical protein
LLAIPLGSVMGYLSRARLKLRRSLADYAARRGLAARGYLPRRAPSNTTCHPVEPLLEPNRP